MKINRNGVLWWQSYYWSTVSIMEQSSIAKRLLPTMFMQNDNYKAVITNNWPSTETLYWFNPYINISPSLNSMTNCRLCMTYSQKRTTCSLHKQFRSYLINDYVSMMWLVNEIVISMFKDLIKVHYSLKADKNNIIKSSRNSRDHLKNITYWEWQVKKHELVKNDQSVKSWHRIDFCPLIESALKVKFCSQIPAPNCRSKRAIF